MRQRWVCVHWPKHTSHCGMHAHRAHCGCSGTVSHGCRWRFACWLCFQSGEQVAHFWIRGIHHFCSGRSLSEPSARQPGLALQVTWPLSWPRWLGALAGQRGDTNQEAQTPTSALVLLNLFNPFFWLLYYYIVTHMNCFWIIFGSQQCPQTSCTLCSLQPCPVSCPVGIKTGKKPWPRGSPLQPPPSTFYHLSCYTGWISLGRTSHEHFGVEK